MSLPWPRLTKEQWAEALKHPDKGRELLAPFYGDIVPSVTLKKIESPRRD